MSQLINQQFEHILGWFAGLVVAQRSCNSKRLEIIAWFFPKKITEEQEKLWLADFSLWRVLIARTFGHFNCLTPNCHAESNNVAYSVQRNRYYEGHHARLMCPKDCTLRVYLVFS